MNRWLEAQFTDDLYEEDLRLGMLPDMAMLWIVKGEGPLQAARSIVVWRAGVFVILPSSRGVRRPIHEPTNGFPY